MVCVFTGSQIANIVVPFSLANRGGDGAAITDEPTKAELTVRVRHAVARGTVKFTA